MAQVDAGEVGEAGTVNMCDPVGAVKRKGSEKHCAEPLRGFTLGMMLSSSTDPLITPFCPCETFYSHRSDPKVCKVPFVMVFLLVPPSDAGTFRPCLSVSTLPSLVFSHDPLQDVEDADVVDGHEGGEVGGDVDPFERRSRRVEGL